MNTADAQVQVDGRRVTVTFDMPFMPGETCITPRQGATTTVRRAPEVAVAITFEGDHAKAQASFGGAWYTTDHTQCHGVAEFLPTEGAFLSYWLEQEPALFADRQSWLMKRFAQHQHILDTLRVHSLNVLRQQIQKRRDQMASDSLIAAREIVRLEAELERAKGVAP